MNFHFTSLILCDNYSNIRALPTDDRLQSLLTDVLICTIATFSRHISSNHSIFKVVILPMALL